MYNRTLYKKLENALTEKQITVITGLRRVGKTTTVNYLLSKINSENKIYFDLERIEYRILFNQQNYSDIIKALEFEGVKFTEKAWIAIDEVQLVPGITSVLKYLYDNYNIKFIITGSVSFYLKNQFNESLAGRKHIFEMTPLTFSEFLIFKDEKSKLPIEDFPEFNAFLYNKLRLLYLEYAEFGGFPEVVLINNPKQKINLLHDIINSYLNIDIKFLADFSRVEEIYKLIILLTSRTGSKVDYSKLGSITGINRKLLKEYILFFEQTHLIRLIPAFVRNRDREIALQKKLYFADNGFLKVLGKVSSGALFENIIANQLNNKGDIKYYARRTGQEIDFILNESIAIEVKETPSNSDLNQLKSIAKSIGIDKTYLVGMQWTNPDFKDFVWGGSLI